MELVVNEFELGVLWDEYGIVGDVVPVVGSNSYLPWSIGF
jgi:hypothetical protein